MLFKLKKIKRQLDKNLIACFFFSFYLIVVFFFFTWTAWHDEYLLVYTKPYERKLWLGKICWGERGAFMLIYKSTFDEKKKKVIRTIVKLKFRLLCLETFRELRDFALPLFPRGWSVLSIYTDQPKADTLRSPVWNYEVNYSVLTLRKTAFNT